MRYSALMSWLIEASMNYRGLVEAEWHIYVSMNYAIIASDNGLSPDRRQTIIWNSAKILSSDPLETNFNEILATNSYIFIQENPFENFVWNMSAISSQPQCVQRDCPLPTWITSLIHTDIVGHIC